MHWHIALAGIVLVLVGMVWLGSTLESTGRPESVSAVLTGPIRWPLLVIVLGIVGLKVAANMGRQRPPGKDDESDSGPDAR